MLQAVAEQYRQQQAIAVTTTAIVKRLWRRMGTEFDSSWAKIGPLMLASVEDGRRAAVDTALGYTPAVLAETNQIGDPIGALNPEMFLSSAPDGRSVATLLDQSVRQAKHAVGAGIAVEEALARGGRFLTMASLTLLADTRREVFGADIIQRPAVTGYVRMLNPPSCKACIILAGKWFRWNTGFDRHPQCDCQHIPGAENVVGDQRTDPYATFESLTPEEQERVFGRSEARAIREGGDIYRIVNTSNPRRGLATVSGHRRYRAPHRMTVDDIYRNAGTRTNAIRMLEREGYILDRGQRVVPRSPGVRTDAEIIRAGRGQGTVTINGQRVTTNRAARFDAVTTGTRDPLRRSTMTAAERRLYDAHYRYSYAARFGTVPRSIGPSSADRFANRIEATPEKLAELRKVLEDQLKQLSDKSPAGTKAVADALGITITKNGGSTPLLNGSGAGGRPPGRPGSFHPFDDEPDPADKDAYDAYWRRRQNALGAGDPGETLARHEIILLEQLQESGHEFTLIPRPDRGPDGSRPASNDIMSRTLGALELKSFRKPKRGPVFDEISNAVTSARRHDVVKDAFVIYSRQYAPTKAFLAQLRDYNQNRPDAAIKRLFWWDGSDLIEIELL